MASRANSVLLLLLASSLCIVSAEQGRKLTATPLNCASLHPQCTSCQLAVKVSPSGSKTTYLQCVTCSGVGYKPFTNLAVTPTPKSTCACIPGYYSKVDTPKVCDVCPKGWFCGGGVGGAATKVSCGTGATTLSTGSQSAASCLNSPGYGYKKDSSVLGFTTPPCPVGTYSAGMTQKACSGCPAGLTTSVQGSTSINACSAPAGYFFVQATKQALQCPVGTFKTGIDQAPACTMCPDGVTTTLPASTSAAACTIAQQLGFVVQTENGQKVARPCPVGYWSNDYTQCTQCIEGLTTAREGATSIAECLAQPGYGYNPQRIDPSKVYKCPGGSYKAGWNKLDCTSCGTNVLTDTTDTGGLGLSADQCYIPAGWGSSKNSAGKLVAKQCVKGQYGASEDIYGINPHPCSPCADNTVTSDLFVTGAGSPPYNSPDNCVAKPGYGWSETNNVAVQCGPGFYKPGYNNNDCTACGAGLTTLAAGAADPSDCVAMPGFEKRASGDVFAYPCNVGFYSTGGAGATCNKCLKGSTTEFPMSSDAAQCNICWPGWGANASPAAGEGLCKVCPSGKFSPGGTDDECSSCGAGETSPPGASDSSDCFDEFTSPSPYDYITTPSSAWLATTTATSAADCETACKGSSTCQYYLFRQDQDEAADNGCFFKVASSSPATDTYVTFKLWTNDYVVWPAGATEYPTDASNKFSSDEVDSTDPWTCNNACDAYASCLAVFITKDSNGWVCYRIDGDFSTTGVVASAVRADPDRINAQPWITP